RADAGAPEFRRRAVRRGRSGLTGFRDPAGFRSRNAEGHSARSGYLAASRRKYGPVRRSPQTAEAARSRTQTFRPPKVVYQRNPVLAVEQYPWTPQSTSSKLSSSVQKRSAALGAAASGCGSRNSPVLVAIFSIIPSSPGTA